MKTPRSVKLSASILAFYTFSVFVVGVLIILAFFRSTFLDAFDAFVVLGFGIFVLICMVPYLVITTLALFQNKHWAWVLTFIYMIFFLVTAIPTVISIPCALFWNILILGPLIYHLIEHRNGKPQSRNLQ